MNSKFEIGKVKWVECGRIGRAVGLRGEVVVRWNSGNSPIEIGGEIFITSQNDPENYRPAQISALRRQGRLSVARFEGIADRERAAALRGSILFIPENKLPPLPKGEYYSYQILGCEVVAECGDLLGIVVRIFTAGGSDVYEVKNQSMPGGKEILIPATSEVVLSVDVVAKKIVVRLLEPAS